MMTCSFWRLGVVAAGLLVGLAGCVATKEKPRSGVVPNPPSTAPATPAAKPSVPVAFTQETLDNGLRVIYAPLLQAPVVHVRVHYHVGSRDERPDRQGFAHMFEHMMFRGSAHVGNQEHMKLINAVGGMSNAFTSFDQTVYLQTLPSEHLEMALYMEADRMASFKVSEDIYKTERKVVGEEWRIRQNRPYGTMYEDLFRTVFTKHSYRWTPIGNMDHLAAAGVTELQDFFNTYYVPNNAVLVVAGDIDVEKTRQWVHRYYSWIPKGPKPPRNMPAEPEQTAARELTVPQRVPLPAVVLGWHTPEYDHPDQAALDMLGAILSGGRSARLDRLLVNNEKPLAVSVGAGNQQLQDSGVFLVNATVMQGKDPKAVEQALRDALADVVEKGVTPEELEKARTLARVSLVRSRQTADSIASELGSEALFAGDADRVNTAMARLEKVTPADVQRVAKTYLDADRGTTLRIKPDPLGAAMRAAATQPAAAEAPVATPAQARAVEFPKDWPQRPPLAPPTSVARFQRGTEKMIDGVRVIVMPDHRLPLVSWTLTTRNGSHSDPAGKEGLASIAGDMLRRGAGDLSYDQLNQDLESRGITLEVSDGGDFTRIGGSSITSQLDHAFDLTKLVLQSPTFPEAEFVKMKEQVLNNLKVRFESPANVASMDLDAALYGKSALGVTPTPASVSSITLDDVKAFYASQLRREGAILMISGDVTVARGQELAKKLLDGWTPANPSVTPLGAPNYQLPPIPGKRKIVLVDRPDAKGATIRMGILAYDNQSEDKWAGQIASRVLTGGIDSRLNRYVRAERGLTYGATGTFQPGRHGGAFIAGADTANETTADTIEAIIKVLGDMRKENITDAELAEARTKVAGNLVMGMQTIQQQAGYRVDGILNGFPADYYDTFVAKVAAVPAGDVRQVMQKYVDDGRMSIVVVAPAAAVKEKLEKLGEVEVVPMPALRDGKDAGPTTKPTPGELLQPATKKAA